jgi:hypothetical protein
VRKKRSVHVCTNMDMTSGLSLPTAIKLGTARYQDVKKLSRCSVKQQALRRVSGGRGVEVFFHAF